MQPIIELHRVSREFTAGTQKIRVLNAVSLSIEQGEMVAIVGASGSGKSTLMNIIGCLDKPRLARSISQEPRFTMQTVRC
jgi:ABC-type antimicrobial peptide transport system, ATPase component